MASWATGSPRSAPRRAGRSSSGRSTRDGSTRGIGKIEKQLARAVEKGKAEQADADAVRGRISGTLDYAQLADCDLVIEAIAEDLEA